MKTGVLLVNLGTPDSPDVPDVRRYLRQFLMDGRVIDIPFWKRFLLVNGIIAPFRAPSSSEEYKKLWDDRGSPLKYYGYDVLELLQKELGEDYVVSLGMRYQNPSIQESLQVFKDKPVDKIIVIPMFPQYASASTGSATQEVMEVLSKELIIPDVVFVEKFFDHPLFIEAFVDQGKAMMDSHDYDHVVFSYHGLPERQILKASVKNYCKLSDCCNTYHVNNAYCYRAQCFATSRLLAKGLGISEDKYTNCFQSRLGKIPWVQPYTDDVIKDLAAKGVKKVLAYSPAFIADCLETTIEVGEAYQEDFLNLGGERWDLVPSLNVNPKWISCLKDLVLTYH